MSGEEWGGRDCESGRLGVGESDWERNTENGVVRGKGAWEMERKRTVSGE